MRPLRLLMLTFVIAAAACTGQATPTPTATTPPPTETAPEVTAPPDSSEMLATTAAENQVVLTPVPVGTLSVADNSGTPNYTPAPLDFDTVVFARYGGITGERVIVRLYSDGRLTIDDVEYQVSPDEVEAIRAVLDQLQFYDVRGTFTGPAAQPDAYQYSIGVSGSRGAKTITLQEGYIPPEMQAVVDMFTLFITNVQQGT